MATKLERRVVKTLAKGQITIPREFREALGIGAGTLLSVRVVGDHLEMAPLTIEDDVLRRFSAADISRFLAEDKLDEGTAQRVRELLVTGAI